MKPHIGLIGPARGGKDFIARYLVERYGYQRLAFADALKAALRSVHLWNGAKDDRGRALLQDFGLAMRECVAPDVWVLPVERQMVVPSVVSDVRFVNEAEMIRGKGGVIVHVTVPVTARVRDHVSEQLASDPGDLPDYTFENPMNDAGECRRRVDALMTSIILAKRGER